MRSGDAVCDQSTHLFSPGALGATAVRSGLRRHTAAAHAFFIMSLFMRNQLFCDVLIFNTSKKKKDTEEVARESRSVSIRGVRYAYTREIKLRKSFY